MKTRFTFACVQRNTSCPRFLVINYSSKETAARNIKLWQQYINQEIWHSLRICVGGTSSEKSSVAKCVLGMENCWAKKARRGSASGTSQSVFDQKLGSSGSLLWIGTTTHTSHTCTHTQHCHVREKTIVCEYSVHFSWRQCAQICWIRCTQVRKKQCWIKCRKSRYSLWEPEHNWKSQSLSARRIAQTDLHFSGGKTRSNVSWILFCYLFDKANLEKRNSEKVSVQKSVGFWTEVFYWVERTSEHKSTSSRWTSIAASFAFFEQHSWRQVPTLCATTRHTIFGYLWDSFVCEILIGSVFFFGVHSCFRLNLSGLHDAETSFKLRPSSFSKQVPLSFTLVTAAMHPPQLFSRQTPQTLA